MARNVRVFVCVSVFVFCLFCFMYSSFCIFVKDTHENFMVHLKGFILNELAEIVSKMNHLFKLK